MFSLNQKISIRQLQMLFIINVFGAGLILLPRQAAAYGGQDGWLIVVLATAAAFVLTWLITTVGRIFPSDSFITMTSKILSAPVAKAIGLLFTLKLIASCALNLKVFSEILRQTLLENTPVFIVIASLSAISAFAASKGYESRARLGQILFPLILAPMIFVFSLAALDSDFTNLKPAFITPANRLGKGVFHIISAFSGIELIMLAQSYARRLTAVRKGLMQAVLCAGIFMTLITAVTIARFGAIDVGRQLWPTLEMMDLIDLPGSFIDRQDALVMSFWILSTFAIVNCELFFSSILLKDVMQKGTHTLYIIIAVSIIIVLACLPFDMETAYQIKNLM
jgi:spore germination protein